MAADSPVSLDGHHGMDVRLTVDNLTGGGHFTRNVGSRRN
jgi:hypothetical protein